MNIEHLQLMLEFNEERLELAKLGLTEEEISGHLDLFIENYISLVGSELDAEN